MLISMFRFDSFFRSFFPLVVCCLAGSIRCTIFSRKHFFVLIEMKLSWNTECVYQNKFGWAKNTYFHRRKHVSQIICFLFLAISPPIQTVNISKQSHTWMVFALNAHFTSFTLTLSLTLSSLFVVATGFCEPPRPLRCFSARFFYYQTTAPLNLQAVSAQLAQFYFSSSYTILKNCRIE